MIRSCFVQSTSKPISQVTVTWSRLFHIRKSLCLAFKPGTGQQENIAGEKGEGKDGVFKHNKHRNTGRLSSSNNAQKVGFYNERESNKFQRQENFMRNNEEYPLSYNRPVRESSEQGRERYRGFRYNENSSSDRDNYRYTKRQNQIFDREQTSFYDERDEPGFDRKEARSSRSFKDSEYGSEESRGYKHVNEYRYTNRENDGRNVERGQTSFYDERDQFDFDGKERRYGRSFGDFEYGSEEGRGFKHFNEYKNSGRNFDRRQSSIYNERNEIDFDIPERSYSRSFRESEYGSEEERRFKHMNGYRYTNRENRGRNFDRGQNSFYDKRGEQGFNKQERTYGRDIKSSVKKDLPYFGEKSDQPDLKRRSFDTFLPDFAESESDIEAKTMEDTEVEKHLKGKLPDDWTETFGTLSSLSETDPTLQSVLFEDENQISRTSTSVTDTVYDEGVEINEEEKPHIRLSKTNRRHIPNWYARRIQKLGKKGLVREAIEVFDKWMIEEDRVKPTHFEFGVLICLLGKAGYTQKAFSLYAQMVKMDLVPDSHILTSLFNACATSPLRNDALKRAHKLRMTMIIQGCEPHVKTYGAMINAFAGCGDTEMALSLVDEALQTHRPSQNFLNCALSACVSDKEAGFRHAIQIWRKFIKLGVRPDIRSYNLLLRAVNECGVGPLTTENTLLLIEAESRLQEEDADKKRKQTKVVSSLQYTVDPNMYSSGSVVEVVEGVSTDGNMSSNPVGGPVVNNANFEAVIGVDGKADGLEVGKGQQIVNVSDWLEYGLVEQSKVQSSDVDAPNTMPETMLDILNPFDRRLQVAYLGWIQSTQHKLALLGGMKGVLSNIEKYHATPDIVTFTQLLLATSNIEEKEIWDMMTLYDVQPDSDFFNHLIVKAVEKGEHRSALEVPALMKERNLVPNLYTYGCLAKACLTQKDAMNMLQSMENANMSPNYVIMHILIKNSRLNFWFKNYLLHKFESLDLTPTAELIEKIEHHISLAKNEMVNLERGKKMRYPWIIDSKKFSKSFKTFMKFYDSWLERTAIQKKEPVWKEYRENIEEPIIDTSEVIEEEKHGPKENKPKTKTEKYGHRKVSTVAESHKKIRSFEKSPDFATKLVDQQNHHQDKLSLQRGLQMNQISSESEY